MKNWLLPALGLAAVTVSAHAQVTATITDTDGTIWANGTWTARLNYSASPTVAGAAVTTTTYSGTLTSAGVLSQTLVPNTGAGSYDQPGTTYTFVICPAASSGCATSQVSIASATQNLSSVLSNSVTAPRFTPGDAKFGYADVELVPPFAIGSIYCNSNAKAFRRWDGQQWNNSAPCGGGSGGGGGTALPSNAPLLGTNSSGTAVPVNSIPSTQVSGLAASATTDTTNAANITSGVVAAARLPLVSTNGPGVLPALPGGTVNFLRADGSFAAPPAGSGATLPASAPLIGTNSAGNAVAVTSVPATQVSGLAASATTDTTNAANISSGTVAPARLPAVSTTQAGILPALPGGTVNFLRADGSFAAPPTSGGTTLPASAPLIGTNSAGNAVSVSSIPTSQITGLAASATTDTTNASNIASGTLLAARLPVATASVPGAVTTAQIPSATSQLTNDAGFLVGLTTIPQNSTGTTYYVSSSTGNDNNAGTSPAAPWKTLAKVNTATVPAASAIRLYSKDIWHEQLNPSANMSVIGPYGPAKQCTFNSDLVAECTNMPIIDGADVVTGWTLQSGTTYKAPFTLTAYKGFVDSIYRQTAPLLQRAWIGTYSATASYIIGQGVTYNGASYLSLANNGVDANGNPVGYGVVAPGTNAVVWAAITGNPTTTAGMVAAQVGTIGSDGTNVYVNLLDGSSPAGHTIEVSSSNRNYAIYLNGPGGITVDGVELIRTALSGYLNYGYGGTGSNNIIRNSITFNNGSSEIDGNMAGNIFAGIMTTAGAGQVSPTGFVATGNGVGRVDYVHAPTQPNNAEAGIVANGMSGATITNNKVATVFGWGIRLQDWFTGDAATKDVCSGGTVFNNEIVNSEGNIADSGCVNPVIGNNNIHDSLGNGLQLGFGVGSSSNISTGAQVINNTIANLTPAYAGALYNGIDSNYTTNTLFQGNRIYKVAASCLTIEDDTSSTTPSGNRVVGNYLDASANLQSNGNAATTAAPVFPLYIIGTALPTIALSQNTIIYNPLSPVIRFGYSASGDATHDYSEAGFDQLRPGASMHALVTAAQTAAANTFTAPQALSGGATVSGALLASQLPTTAGAYIGNPGGGTATYTYVVTDVDAAGGESTGTPVTLSGNGPNNLTSSAVQIIPGAFATGSVKQNVYRTVSTGTPSTTGFIGAITTSGGLITDNGITPTAKQYAASNTSGTVAVPQLRAYNNMTVGVSGSTAQGIVQFNDGPNGTAGNTSSIFMNYANLNLSNYTGGYQFNTGTAHRVMFQEAGSPYATGSLTYDGASGTSLGLLFVSGLSQTFQLGESAGATAWNLRNSGATNIGTVDSLGRARFSGTVSGGLSTITSTTTAIPATSTVTVNLSAAYTPTWAAPVGSPTAVLRVCQGATVYAFNPAANMKGFNGMTTTANQCTRWPAQYFTDTATWEATGPGISY